MPKPTPDEVLDQHITHLPEDRKSAVIEVADTMASAMKLLERYFAPGDIKPDHALRVTEAILERYDLGLDDGEDEEE